MKKLKRVLSVLLTAALFLGMTVTASAANVTIKDGNKDATYSAYRVLDLKTVLTCKETHTHTDACYGYAYTVNAKYKDILLTISNVNTAGKSDAQISADIVKYVEDLNEAQTRTFADAVYKASKDANLPADLTSTSGVFTGIPQGYYLIVETTKPLGNSESYSLVMLDTAGQENVTIDSKIGTTPTVDKKVSDRIDGTFGDITDVSVGDTVYFEITGTMPTDLDEYEKYEYTFYDTLSKGLTYVPNSAKVYLVNGAASKEVTTTFTTSTPVVAGDGKSTFNVSAANVLGLRALGETVNKDSKFVLKYSATLNKDAVIGGTGNPNDVYLEFSNDPNPDGYGTKGKTPDDTVLVFTFELDVNKTNMDKSVKLKDAKFVLYREVSSVKQYAVIANGKVSSWTPTLASATTFTSDDNGFFNIVGLDVGTYFLEETVAPEGYNLLLKPVQLTIAATYTTNPDALATLKITVDEVTTDGTLANGVVSMTVLNNTGSELPNTGGMGTTILYIIGALMVMLAAVLLIVRKRMSIR